jgi:probable phosphomutase (TIGR03848 family)
MPIFLLVRHGENEYVKTGRLAGRQPGIHLNDKGREQAQTVAQQLKDLPIKAVYSSPLERAMETAEPIAKRFNLPIIQRSGLIETDCGDWQNQKVKGLSRLKQWKNVQSSPATFRFPGGESFRDAHARITAELLELTEQHDPKDVIACVSHADPIKLAVAYFIGLPLDLFQRLSIAPGSVTTLAITETGGRLLSLNIEAELKVPKS